MRERFNWLMVTQPVLFTAMAFAVKERNFDCNVQPPSLAADQRTAAINACVGQNKILDEVLMLVIGLGLVISSLVLISLIAAGRMHWVWTSNLNSLASKLHAGAAQRSPIATFGLKPHWPARTSSLIGPTLAAVFVVIWLYLLLTILQSTVHMTAIVAAVIALVMFVVLTARFSQSTPMRAPEYAIIKEAD